ncbi:HTH domain-containing protein [uncultured Duncaniella sp.]|jgi:predicted ArsR family transcriptional regulator|uniref:HTH domain-containing protein n=1 Tax=uncultured Duncaniella sp. TaxID=2768039 RepID=UPI0033A86BB2
MPLKRTITDNNVAQEGVDVAQNLDDCIVAMIQERPNVKREEMARHLSVTKNTIERHLKDLKIS